MRKLRFLLLLMLFPFFSFADNSGTGCLLGEEYVYTQYLGTSKVIGWDDAQYKYYNVNGPKIPVYPGYGMNQHRGYRCGYINRFDASSYHDPTILPYGADVPFGAEQEYTLLGPDCKTSSSLGGQPMTAGNASGNGKYVSYTYNRTNQCAVAPPTNMPLDDYVWVLLIGTAALFVFFIKNTNEDSISV